MKEIWKIIPDFPNYEISNLGKVRSLKTLRTLKPQIAKANKKYDYARMTIVLRKNGKSYNNKIASLVLTVFSGPCPESMEACHNDGNTFNNTIDNLRWDTHKANSLDSKIHGTFSAPPIHIGENHPRCKLTDEQVNRIRLEGGIRGNQTKLAKEFGVDFRTISRIYTGKRRLL